MDIRWGASAAAILLAGAIGAAAQNVVREESREQWSRDGSSAVAAALAMRTPPTRAKNVILFVGDGMGVSTVTAARILAGQMLGGPGEDHQLAFEAFPYLALSKTYSVNQQVADSAPTMTAMITGVKTGDGILSLDQRAVHDDPASAEGRELPTLLEIAEDRGLSTGVVSTARLTHATPAATYAHSVNRDWEDDAAMPPAARATGYPDIARQFAEFDHGDGIDVALGGGRSHFMPNTEADPEYPRVRGRRKDGRDLIAEWQHRYADGTYVWNAAQFQAASAATTRRLFGLFERGHMQYEHDRSGDPAGEPSLTEMTAKAIDILSRNPRGFVLMVEAGRIDHAHHDGNAYRALTDTIELSNAVRLAASRTSADDTLIVVTADHSHTLTISGSATRGNPILGLVADNDAAGRPLPYPEVDRHGKPYTTLGYRNGPGASREVPSLRPILTFHDTADPDYLQEAQVPLASESHAGEDVAIYARGPASQLFHGVQEQNYIFHVLAHALGFAP
ncbi:MAG: alkaline phosphatase [Vicinamibacterales bacterium]